MQIDECRVNATHKQSALVQAVTARAKQTRQRVELYRADLSRLAAGREYTGQSLQEIRHDIADMRRESAQRDVGDMVRHIGITDAQMRAALRLGGRGDSGVLAAIKRLRRYGKLCPWWTAAHQRALPVLPTNGGGQ